MTTFVDSSAWVAGADRGDSDHERAADLLTRTPPHVTTDHVLVETWVLLNRRLHRSVADEFAERCLAGGLDLAVVRRADLDRAEEIRRDFPDQRFSIVDRTSFAVMERLGITRVVTLDDDFAVYRYGRGRRKAFEVLR